MLWSAMVFMASKSEFRIRCARPARRNSRFAANTALYRLKTHSEKVILALALLAEGVDVSALERVLGIGEGTLRTWLTHAGLHAAKLHSTLFQELLFRHIQLDELWANVRHATQESVGCGLLPKPLPRSSLSFSLAHAPSIWPWPSCTACAAGVQPDCSPVFTTDGLKLYFYALTAHFGGWSLPDGGGKPIWQVATESLYAQVKRSTAVANWSKSNAMCYAGNLPRSKSACRLLVFPDTSTLPSSSASTWPSVRGSSWFAVRGVPLNSPPNLMSTWNGGAPHHHFSRYHELLRIQFPEPVQRKGKQLPRRYRSRTPAMAAGLVSRCWSVLESAELPLAWMTRQGGVMI